MGVEKKINDLMAAKKIAKKAKKEKKEKKEKKPKKVAEKKEEKKEVQKEQTKAIHPDVICDGCNMAPIKGHRFKCITKHDYDLCENCEKVMDKDHLFLRITDPKVFANQPVDSNGNMLLVSDIFVPELGTNYKGVRHNPKCKNHPAKDLLSSILPIDDIFQKIDVPNVQKEITENISPVVENALGAFLEMFMEPPPEAKAQKKNEKREQ